MSLNVNGKNNNRKLIMNANFFHVVGDKFKNFSSNKYVMTMSELAELTNIYRIGSQPGYTLLLGQGVSVGKLEEVLEKINKNGLNNYFSIKYSDVLDNKNSQQLCHKAKLDNVMITTPHVFAKNTYISQMSLQDDCAEMNDHVTGQHIQGMILIEAARQMMLSVSENFILDEEKRGKYYFVLNNVNSSFYQFTFPLQVSVFCEVVNLERSSKGTVKAKMKFSFMQNNIEVTEVEINFAAYEKVFLEAKEKLLAESAIQAALKIDKGRLVREMQKNTAEPVKRKMHV
jgi:hypothetical protein